MCGDCVAEMKRVSEITGFQEGVVIAVYHAISQARREESGELREVLDQLTGERTRLLAEQGQDSEPVGEDEELEDAFAGIMGLRKFLLGNEPFVLIRYTQEDGKEYMNIVGGGGVTGQLAYTMAESAMLSLAGQNGPVTLSDGSLLLGREEQ